MMIRTQSTRPQYRVCRVSLFASLPGLALIVGGCPLAPNSLVSNATTARIAGDQPTIEAPKDQTVECDGNGNKQALQDWLGSATLTEGCGGAVLSNDFETLPLTCGATGTVTVTWIVTDQCDASASDSSSFTIVDTSLPNLTAPKPLTLSCGDPDTAEALNTWLAAATATDTCAAVTITSERSSEPGNCVATVTWTATDDCGNAVSASSTYTITGDTTAPTLGLVGEAEITLECGDVWNDPGITVSDDCDALTEADVTGDVDSHLPGTYALSYSATDACGNAAPSLTRTVTVVDTEPPIVTVAAPISLWPPNHKLKTFTMADLVTIEDACAGVVNADEVATILDIYCDEPDADTSDGNAVGDIVIVDSHTFTVRAERAGGGNGRVYGVRFEIEDSAGNSTEMTAFIHVPHDQSGRAVIDDGAAVGQIVTR